jgi:hypothetical protein
MKFKISENHILIGYSIIILIIGLLLIYLLKKTKKSSKNIEGFVTGEEIYEDAKAGNFNLLRFQKYPPDPKTPTPQQFSFTQIKIYLMDGTEFEIKTIGRTGGRNSSSNIMDKLKVSNNTDKITVVSDTSTDIDILKRGAVLDINYGPDTSVSPAKNIDYIKNMKDIDRIEIIGETVDDIKTFDQLKLHFIRSSLNDPTDRRKGFSGWHYIFIFNLSIPDDYNSNKFILNVNVNYYLQNRIRSKNIENITPYSFRESVGKLIQYEMSDYDRDEDSGKGSSWHPIEYLIDDNITNEPRSQKFFIRNYGTNDYRMAFKIKINDAYYDNMKNIIGFVIKTAYDRPSRDPTSIKIYASNTDDFNVGTDIDEISSNKLIFESDKLLLPDERYYEKFYQMKPQKYKYYLITFPTIKGTDSNNVQTQVRRFYLIEDYIIPNIINNVDNNIISQNVIKNTLSYGCNKIPTPYEYKGDYAKITNSAIYSSSSLTRSINPNGLYKKVNENRYVKIGEYYNVVGDIKLEKHTDNNWIYGVDNVHTFYSQQNSGNLTYPWEVSWPSNSINVASYEFNDDTIPSCYNIMQYRTTFDTNINMNLISESLSDLGIMDPIGTYVITNKKKNGRYVYKNVKDNRITLEYRGGVNNNNNENRWSIIVSDRVRFFESGTTMDLLPPVAGWNKSHNIINYNIVNIEKTDNTQIETVGDFINQISESFFDIKNLFINKKNKILELFSGNVGRIEGYQNQNNAVKYLKLIENKNNLINYSLITLDNANIKPYYFTISDSSLKVSVPMENTDENKSNINNSGKRLIDNQFSPNVLLKNEIINTDKFFMVNKNGVTRMAFTISIDDDYYTNSMENFKGFIIQTSADNSDKRSPKSIHIYGSDNLENFNELLLKIDDLDLPDINSKFVYYELSQPLKKYKHYLIKILDIKDPSNHIQLSKFYFVDNAVLINNIEISLPQGTVYYKNQIIPRDINDDKTGVKPESEPQFAFNTLSNSNNNRYLQLRELELLNKDGNNMFIKQGYVKKVDIDNPGGEKVYTSGFSPPNNSDLNNIKNSIDTLFNGKKDPIRDFNVYTDREFHGAAIASGNTYKLILSIKPTNILKINKFLLYHRTNSNVFRHVDLKMKFSYNFNNQEKEIYSTKPLTTDDLRDIISNKNSISEVDLTICNAIKIFVPDCYYRLNINKVEIVFTNGVRYSPNNGYYLDNDNRIKMINFNLNNRLEYPSEKTNNTYLYLPLDKKYNIRNIKKMDIFLDKLNINDNIGIRYQLLYNGNNIITKKNIENSIIVFENQRGEMKEILNGNARNSIYPYYKIEYVFPWVVWGYGQDSYDCPSGFKKIKFSIGHSKMMNNPRCVNYNEALYWDKNENPSNKYNVGFNNSEIFPIHLKFDGSDNMGSTRGNDIVIPTSSNGDSISSVRFVKDPFNNEETYTYFPGDGNSYLKLGNNFKHIFDRRPFSISFKVKFQSTETSGFSPIFIIHNENNSSNYTNNHILFIGRREDTNKLSIDFYGGTTVTDNVLNNDVWYDIICTFNQQTGKKIYVNGDLKASSTRPLEKIPFTMDDNSEFWVGRYKLDDSTYKFKGGLKDVKIYNYDIKATKLENLTIKDKLQGVTGVVPYKTFKFDGNDTDIVKPPGSNVSFSNNTATFSGGENHYLKINNNNIRDIFKSTEFSIVFSVYIENTDNIFVPIIQIESDGVYEKNKVLHIGRRSTADNNVITFAFYGNDINTNISINNNTWYDIVCTYSVSNGKKIFVNNLLSYESLQQDRLIIEPSANMYLGRGYVGKEPIHALKGKLKNLKIFDKDISDISNNTIKRKCDSNYGDNGYFPCDNLNLPICIDYENDLGYCISSRGDTIIQDFDQTNTCQSPIIAREPTNTKAPTTTQPTTTTQPPITTLYVSPIEQTIPTQPYTTQPYTTQPYTTQPYTTQPYTTQPSVTQPYTTQPYTTQPYTTQPYTTQPYTTQPYTTQPSVTQPYTTQPYTTQPYTTQPYTTQPSATQPSATQPYTTQPSVTQPYTTQTSVTQPYTTQPSVTQPSATQPLITRPSVTQPLTTRSSVTQPLTTRPSVIFSSSSSDLGTALSSGNISPGVTSLLNTTSNFKNILNRNIREKFLDRNIINTINITDYNITNIIQIINSLRRQENPTPSTTKNINDLILLLGLLINLKKSSLKAGYLDRNNSFVTFGNNYNQIIKPFLSIVDGYTDQYYRVTNTQSYNNNIVIMFDADTDTIKVPVKGFELTYITSVKWNVSLYGSKCNRQELNFTDFDLIENVSITDIQPNITFPSSAGTSKKRFNIEFDNSNILNYRRFMIVFKNVSDGDNEIILKSIKFVLDLANTTIPTLQSCGSTSTNTTTPQTTNPITTVSQIKRSSNSGQTQINQQNQNQSYLGGRYISPMGQTGFNGKAIYSEGAEGISSIFLPSIKYI